MENQISDAITLFCLFLLIYWIAVACISAWDKRIVRKMENEALEHMDRLKKLGVRHE